MVAVRQAAITIARNVICKFSLTWTFISCDYQKAACVHFQSSFCRGKERNKNVEENKSFGILINAI